MIERRPTALPRPMRGVLRASAALALLAACAEQPQPAPIVYRGTDPAATAAAPPQPGPALAAPAARTDGRGVVDYGGFQAVVAQPGDTVGSMAARVGISEAALASYNGLPANHTPRPGDELILPPAATQPLTSTVETAPLAPPDAPQTEVAAATPAASEPFDLDSIEASLEPEEARVPQAPDPAPAAPPAPTARAATAPAPFEPAPDQTVRAAPPAAVEPAPVAQPGPASPPAEVAAATPAQPAPSAPASGAAIFAAPVDGPITRAYSTGAGGPRNDGVDFSAPAGATVTAAADGQVALISDSLGGLGTIVLIRHQGELLTVYGRVADVVVAKGERVRRGQPIGVVAPAADGPATLHFEVREGANSVNPEDYLAG
jgi:murein DD-endopeptidase MepM/ murein hydrolase activator NlpD